MDSIPGFVSIPRLAGSPRPAGAFFSALVESAAGPGAWRVRLDGRSLVISSDLALIPGQVLKLKLADQRGARWLFQVVTEIRGATIANTSTEMSPLMAAFLSRGLPLAMDRLAAWTRWTAKTGPSDKESWAASLEARGEGPHSRLSEQISPWFEWQAALEQGRSSPPPDDQGYWDEWNLRKPASDPWLVMPLRWEYEGQVDAGLLQAYWNPQKQAIDRWFLTAAPAETAFRLEAAVRPANLDLVWRFFREDQRQYWEAWAVRERPRLSIPGMTVALSITGASQPSRISGGVDVRA